ncbi:class I SAM-dependent methyltransferase [Alkalibacterium psychrotolerans]
MSYNWFAQIYDELMDDSLYHKWLTYTAERISPSDTILELGCGTGILGIMLTKAGYDLTGLDLSEEMLSLAYDRQIEEDTFFPLIQRDMRDLSELPEYDSVICYSDALCYMTDEQELLTVFKEVQSSLESEGVFLFDVHSVYKISEFLETSFHAEVENIFFAWDSYEGNHPHSVEHHLSFFVHTELDKYQRFEEIHKERTYPLETYRDLLEKAGFRTVEVTADFGEKITEKSRRWFFEARK